MFLVYSNGVDSLDGRKSWTVSNMTSSMASAINCVNERLIAYHRGLKCNCVDHNGYDSDDEAAIVQCEAFPFKIEEWNELVGRIDKVVIKSTADIERYSHLPPMNIPSKQ